MTTTPEQPERPRPASPSRRTLLGGAAVLTGAALGGAVAGHAAARSGVAVDGPPAGTATAATTFGAQTVAFHGEHQAGIATPQQAHGMFIGLDLRPGANRARLAGMLQVLSDDAARLTQGRAPLAALEGDTAATPSRLTVTFGFGPGLFTAAGRAAACPAVIASFPTFTTDRLEKAWGQSDLLLQVCADDPVTMSYAARRLVRDAAPFTTVRWTQAGFVNARGTEADGTTARNLMGMRDGTANERDPAQVDQVLWNRDPALPWLNGGSQLVLRRIRIDLPTWDDVEPEAKEISFGRRLADGSPLTGHHEFDVLDRHARDATGFLIVEPNAHAARAQARSGAERMIRRAYNYDDGFRPDGTADTGLLFAAYQADLATAFVPVQRRLAASDALNTWTTHVGSAVYAVPPGAPEGSYVGATLVA